MQWRSEAAGLKLLTCAALWCAARADYGGGLPAHASVPCGVSTAVAPSRVPTTHLRLRGGSGSDAALLDARLKALIKQAPVMLFMKGEPDAPQCGFSRCVRGRRREHNVRPRTNTAKLSRVRTCRTIVALLREHGVTFEHFDILEDEEVRQGLKRFSNWPTYPQVRSVALRGVRIRAIV